MQRPRSRDSGAEPSKSAVGRGGAALRTPSPVDGDARATRLTSQLVALSVVLAVVPIAVATVRAVHSHWLPIGDNSLVYVRTKDVFSRHPPLTYMWSTGSTWAKADYNNPGPLLYDLLAIPTAVLGMNGPLIGISLLNCSTVVAIALVARRVGGALLATAAMAVTATLAWSLGNKLLYDPWPPNSLLLPFLLYLLLVWWAIRGSHWAIPLLAFVGTFLLQTNLSYALLAPLLGAFGLCGFLLALRRQRSLDPRDWPRLRRQARWTGGVTAILLAALWAQPVIEEFTARGDGNLTLIARGLNDLTSTLGVFRGLRFVAAVTMVRGWLRGSLESVYNREISGRAALLAVLALAVIMGLLGWSARRCRDRTESAGIATAILALTVATVTMVRSPVDGLGQVMPYRSRFLWPVAAFVTLVVLFALARRLTRRASSLLVAAGMFTLITLLVAILNLPAYKPAWGTHEPDESYATMGDLNRQLSHEELKGTVLVDWDRSAPFFSQYYYDGVLAELERRGVPFVVNQHFLVRTLGDQRRYTGRADVRLTLGMGERALAGRPGTRRIALHLGLTEKEQSTLSALRRNVVDYVDSGRFRLNARGAKGLAALAGPERSSTKAPTPETIDGTRLVASGSMLSLFDGHFLVLSGADRSLFERWAFLEHESERRTVGVFLSPGNRGRPQDSKQHQPSNALR